MAGEKIYFDLATLCEQARIPLEDVRAAAAVPAGGVGADPGGAVAEGNRRRAVVQLEDGSDLVGAQVDARDAVVSEQGAVAADDHPQIAAAERLVAGHREGEVDRLGVRRVQRARGSAAGARFEPGEERVLRRCVVLVRARDPGVAVPVDNGVEGLRGKAGAGLDGVGAEVVAGDRVVAVVRGPDRGGRDHDRAGLDPYRYH